MIQTNRRQLFYLCALGLWGLWGFAAFNGMFDRLNTVMETRVMPDGRQLRDTYSGNAFLDERLTLLSAFYEVLSNDFSSGPRLLFFDINFVVACTNLWALIESRRLGVRNAFLKWPVWAMILWNANGAAIVQPLFFYLLCKSKTRLRSTAIPTNDARALFIATFAILLSPLLIFAPAWANSPTSGHHGSIAYFHYSPVFVLGLFLATSSLLPTKPSSGRAIEAAKESKKWIVLSLILAGITSAAVHIYTVVSALISRDPDISLLRLFVPIRATTDPIYSLPVASKSLVPEYAALLENLHLFSQYDWIVVTMSCIVFTHTLLSRRDGEDKPKEIVSREETRELAYLSVATLLLGPGAAGSFALAIREARI
ncbi:hypothetical protein NUW58_g2950 [Xylaria curta]|uniref:Uncharacterized protein n=1 Tax=Xylaria curta TaxID=42375 RepID=A0ACC1PD81_9PEZI|nr:hypothetical protein NUW58_g2950 [Xylaria curta]